MTSLKIILEDFDKKFANPTAETPNCSENDKNECTPICGYNKAIADYKLAVKKFLEDYP